MANPTWAVSKASFTMQYLPSDYSTSRTCLVFTEMYLSPLCLLKNKKKSNHQMTWGRNVAQSNSIMQFPLIVSVTIMKTHSRNGWITSDSLKTSYTRNAEELLCEEKKKLNHLISFYLDYTLASIWIALWNKYISEQSCPRELKLCLFQRQKAIK